jgi:SSS family solute:Na+ symporter
MFKALAQTRPAHLTMPGSTTNMGHAWYISTVLLTSLGFYMWPHSFGSIYTARDERIFRRNAILLPIYQLILLFVFFVGFAAILKVPGLKGPEIDLSLLKLSAQTFPAWTVGIIGAAGVLTALVPGSMILITAATLLANNIYGAFRKEAGEAAISRLARLLVPVVALVAVYFTLRGGATIVALLLMGYSFVTQLLPALVCSLMERNPATREGAFAGIFVGVATVALISLTHTTLGTLLPSLPQSVKDLNIGIVALVANIVVLAVVSAATQARQAPRTISSSR